MNYPSMPRQTMLHSRRIAAGPTFIAAALILILSASSMVHAQELQAQGTPVQRSVATSGQFLGAQIRPSKTSMERQHRIAVGEPARRGAVKKNPQRSHTRQEMDQKGKAGAESSTARDQGNQRKARRALA